MSQKKLKLISIILAEALWKKAIELKIIKVQLILVTKEQI